MKVCEKVQKKGVTTYNEVADELVAEFSSSDNHMSPNDAVSPADQRALTCTGTSGFIKFLQSLCVFEACVRPEEHPTTCVRRTKCTHGHEHHLEREERNQMDRPSHQLSTRVPKPRGENIHHQQLNTSFPKFSPLTLFDRWRGKDGWRGSSRNNHSSRSSSCR